MTNDEKLILWEELMAPLRGLALAMFFTISVSITELKEEARALGVILED